MLESSLYTLYLAFDTKMPMQYHLRSLQVSFEINFAKPSFEFATSALPVLRALHERLSPRFPVASRDLSVEPGSTVDSVRARASLFNGQGTVDVAADWLKLTFENVSYPEDVAVIQECTELVWQAVQGALSDVTPHSYSTSVRYFAELQDPPNSARIFLAETLAVRHDHLTEAAGHGASVIPEHRVSVVNDDEKWRFFGQIEHAIAAASDVFVTAHATYGAGGRFDALKDRITHFDKLLSSVFADLGMTSGPIDT